MENSVEVPFEIKNRTALWSHNPTSGCTPKRTEIKILKRVCSPLSTATLFVRIEVCSYVLVGALFLHLLPGSSLVLALWGAVLGEILSTKSWVSVLRLLSVSSSQHI